MSEPNTCGCKKPTCVVCLGNEVEQLRVQLAGCLTAAEGHGCSEKDACKPGQYGYSLSYEKTLDLRRKYNKLLEARNSALKELGIPQPGYPVPVWNAIRFLKDAAPEYDAFLRDLASWSDKVAKVPEGKPTEAEQGPAVPGS